jgi:hypothetical protein
MNKNQVKKNQGQERILLEYACLPGLLHPGSNPLCQKEKECKKKSLDENIKEKQGGFFYKNVLLAKKIEPDRYLLRKAGVGIKDHQPGNADEYAVEDNKNDSGSFHLSPA